MTREVEPLEKFEVVSAGRLQVRRAFFSKLKLGNNSVLSKLSFLLIWLFKGD